VIETREIPVIAGKLSMDGVRRTPVQKTARSIPSWVGCRNAPPQEPSPSWSERFKGDRRQQGQRPDLKV